MGISDDIRPKKSKIKENEKVEEEILPDPEGEDGELVSIKHGEDHDFVDQDIEEQMKKMEEDDNQEDMANYFYRPSKDDKNNKSENRNKKGSFGKWLIVILILALVVIIVWQNLDSIKSYLGIKSTDSASTTNSNDLYSDFSVTGTSGTGSAVSDTSVPTTTTEPAATTPVATPAKTSYSISVLNGNGIKGSAASVKSSIINAGYNVTNTGNALKFTYPDTIIYYKTGNSVLASEIKTVLSSRTSELSEDNAIVGNYDIVVVVGKL